MSGLYSAKNDFRRQSSPYFVPGTREIVRKRRRESPDLAGRAKGDPEKVKIARRLRTETSVTLKWIAEQLQMGKWTHVANLLQQTSENPSDSSQMGWNFSVNNKD